LKIAMVIAALGPGGSERVFTRLASGFDRRGHDVHILTLSGGGRFYPLSDRVSVHPLDLASPYRSLLSSLQANRTRARTLAETVRRVRPDVVLSFGDTTNVLTLLAISPGPVPVIISERTNPRRHAIPWIWRALRRAVYSRAATLVAPAEFVRRCFNDSDVAVIPNPAPDEVPQLSSARRPVILSMGRLDRHKGHALLLESFAPLAARFPTWSVEIVGDGPERTALETRAASLAAGNVKILGLVPDPLPLLAQGELFAFPSAYEGMSNAVLEAMACGLVPVAFRCEGMEELITDDVDGVLVPPGDTEAFGRALERLMNDSALRDRMRLRASEVRERFAWKPILDRWESLLARYAQAAGLKGGRRRSE
jgi:glycosyltransferase involved in cell wall biosynthesis